MTTHPQYPVAKTQNLELQELSGELLIYDMERHKAHCLNLSIATIWRACDGTRDVAALALVLQEKLQTPIHEEVVWSALEQLNKTHLLTTTITKPSKQEKVSRREMARRIGGVALIPAIASLLAPRAAQAGTCKQLTGRNNGCACGVNGECASNRCLGSPKKCI
jgi:hypothetical protein